MECSKTKEFIFRSKLPDIEEIPKHLPLHTYCFEKLDEVRDRPCIIDGPTGKIYTHGDVEIAARRVASGLAKLGISQRDVVMLLLPNCPEFAFVFFGVGFRGATATTANPLYTSWEISKQARACKAKMVVTQSAYAGKLFELREVDGVKVVCVDDDEVVRPDGCLAFACLKDADEKEMESVEVLPEDVVALPYSSGTTGMPKGVMLTHRGMVTDAAQHVDGQNPNVYMTRDDVVLCVLPLFHVYSLSILLAAIRAGSAVVVMDKFEIATMMELVQRHRVSVAPIVPPIVVAMVKSPAIDAYDLTSIRVVMSRAAPLGKELQDALRAKMPKATLGQGYGMTEAGPVISMCLAFAKEPFQIKSGSCGTVVRNAELKIVDPITGLSLPRKQAGEICVRGPQIMKGYLNDPEATARTIDKEGWLHTGDVGLVDDDDELFIVDRLKELIKYKGFQVAPAELEALLLAHPSVADAAVVPMKDSTAGEIPVAFVVRSNGSPVTEDDIKKFIAKQVVFYKKLHKVFFVEAIPKAPSGKILRRELRARLARVARVEREGAISIRMPQLERD